MPSINPLTKYAGGFVRGFSAPDDDDSLLHAELFSADQMEQHGRALAGLHVLGTSTRDQLLQRLDDNEKVLIAARDLLTESLKAGGRVPPAAEWLLDNFYLIEEQIQTAQRHLPKAYSRQLPRLAEGNSRQLPRVYDLALAVISHSDGRVREDILRRFVAAYQELTPLKLGELWAIPIMLRLALVENLRRVSARLLSAREQVNQARQWADRMIETAASEPRDLVLVLADMARSKPKMQSSFVAELTQRLQGHATGLSLPLAWIEQYLAESSLTIEQLVLAESQQQAVDQLAISNSIASLRLLGAIDWRLFVEAMSGVELMLREDPAGVYAAMDFATRDRYRHVVANLAHYTPLTEIDIARAAVTLAHSGGDDANEGFARHVGYYLIDAGYPQLEAAVQAEVSLWTQLQRKLTSAPLALYLGGILLLTIAFTGSLMTLLPQPGSTTRFLMAFVLLLGASQLAMTLMNWLTTVLASPDLLPRMNYSEGIPQATRALVVVPTLLTSESGVDSLLEDLEIRFLGNRDKHLYFGLLTDFPDAQAEIMPTDAALLEQVSTGIALLNAKYAAAEGEPSNTFFLFHRPRRWNAADKVWMGYERKRGKQAALNALLRGKGLEEFARIVGDVTVLQGIPYVITLDTDTQLPRDAARQLIATMAHPLNRARYDTGRQLIVGGYGILQPSIAATLDGAMRSRYAQLSGSEPGIDPYTRSVSDIYQDLYNEGSFIGKGIYDVDAFEYALNGRFPENRILSHDLLEGCYARSGLVSDIRLYEEQPARYAAEVNRQRRWIRGDWQIARWLLPRVPGMETSQPNPLSGLSQWKIFDNLRRSVVPAALVAILLFAWFATGQAFIWTLAVAGSYVLQPVLAALLCLLRSTGDIGMRQTLLKTRRSLVESLALNAFRFATLPYEAWYSLDAIARVAWRLLVSRRGLLEWSPQAIEAQKPVVGLSGNYRRMWIAPALALATGLLLAYLDSSALVSALPVLCLWLAAPTLAWGISQPMTRTVAVVNATQRRFLRRVARKTWAFFERFHSAADNWLPPDNYQEAPGPILAHRTSPTNIGLALLSNLTAHDFGYIPTGTLLARIDASFGTLDELERYHGHFYNWYDTLTLQPLAPRYVSSVDSGNLAAHLLVLREGLLTLPDAKIADQRIFRGLLDTLTVPQHTLTTALGASSSDALRALQQLETQVDKFIDEAPANLDALLQALVLLMAAAQATANAPHFKALPPTADDAGEWLDTFARQCREHIDELLLLAPWLTQGPAPDALMQAVPQLAAHAARIPTLRELAEETFDPVLEAALPADLSASHSAWLQQWRAARKLGAEHAALRIATGEQLARQAEAFADMEYEFLYDRTRHLLAIGYNVDEFRRDGSFYDLLASEARLCSFVAIAQGKLPQESWFALGRLLTNAGGNPVLVSWSGSMFEYLMPLLVMPSYESTLLDRTCRAAVAHQIAYGRQRGVPWGISESGYNLTDAHLNYQYHAFGVPGLGLQRGLGNNLVISPYASALALLVAPDAAAHNLQHLSTSGFEGPYGFYEAIDYTPARLGRAQSHVVVRSYMAHHQGMTLLSLAHQLGDAPMQRRFAAVPLFQATLLLLQERIPATSLFYNPPPEDRVENVVPITGEPQVHVPLGAVTPVPEVQLLSNGRYHVMLTNAGGGYSRWKDAAITRWREDTTRDHWGSFIYLRDADSGEFWSTTHQPTLKKATSYEALFNTGRAEYRRQDHDIETYTEVVISPEDDVELRRVRLTNRSRTARTIEVTSYAEVVLNAPAADAMQPAFSNLFVQTKILRERQAIICTRRPRSAVEHPPCLLHLLRANGVEAADISYETDRMRFIGRGQTLEAPAAIVDSVALSGSDGSVLDPIVAIRCKVTIPAHKSVTLDFVYGIGADGDLCSTLIDKYQDRHLTDRAFDMAYPHAAVTLRQINATETDAQLYRRLAGYMLYARQTLRADPSVLLQNRRGQSGLWGYAISGDLPILLLKISSVSHIELARQLIQCHAYWRLKGLMTDLVIWNEDHVGYRQVLLDRIMALVATGPDAHAIDRPGGIFVRSGEQISSEDRILLQTVARAIISDDQGTLVEQLKRREAPERRVARLTTIRPHRAELPETISPEQKGLVLTNGLGGFTADGREYVITTLPGRMTPLPWVNVLANPDFGSVVAETGLGYTWSENAHEFRLTPWSNDAVGASGGEAFYLRDEESGHFWSPTPLPAPGNQSYRTRHGFGYSVFEYRSGGGLVSELSVYVDLEMPVKFFVLKVRNESSRPRKLSATGYVEWVLGDLRTKSSMHVVTEIDAASGALFARNAYHSEFGSRVGFFDVDDASRTLTGDRNEFFGRTGSLASPDAMTRARLSGRLGAGFDPCGAIQVPFELAVGQERQIIFRLGAGRSREHARELARRLRTPGSARAALEKVQQYWRHTLDAVRIETPDPALNMLTNGWLIYQTLACRFWARSGFYQSGGAYGFRDQLQDAMALVHARPEVLRQQLLRSAAHQYLEGDVQHWWHPPADRGVRTRCSDDYLWLPLAASRYVTVTGDAALLSEPVPFITGRALAAEEESYYDLPVPANESASLYKHCVLAIEHGLRFGERGLPLMGSGDWNDGMNLVGIHGKGESVWLGFFLYRVLKDFAVIAKMRDDVEFAERCQLEAEKLRQNLSAHAWDGQWYKRAWFDDGTPLGSSVNEECAIDSIAQSWSVLSGAGEPERSQVALESLDKHLVRRDAKLIQLLDPPFDKSALDPGYIKGYVPGVRENGGQYTHAAIWAAMAFAVSGNSERAWELLSMINPVNHGTDPALVDVYKAEPYVVAADVYGVAPHTGRGGWSWYTGSAGWMYRLIIEALLGLQREGSRLLLNPSMPAAWQNCALHYRFGESMYHINVTRGVGAATKHVVLDGAEQGDNGIDLIDDGQEHNVEVTIS